MGGASHLKTHAADEGSAAQPAPGDRPSAGGPLAVFLLAAVVLAGMLVIGAGCAGKANRSQLPAGWSWVTFTYATAAESICLGGDFNSWATDGPCLQRQGGAWRTTAAMPKGRNSYAFFVDGQRWTPDPEALIQEDDGFGRTNSVVVVD